MWFLPEQALLILPVAVTLKRFLAALLVFILGMIISSVYFLV